MWRWRWTLNRVLAAAARGGSICQHLAPTARERACAWISGAAAFASTAGKGVRARIAGAAAFASTASEDHTNVHLSQTNKKFGLDGFIVLSLCKEHIVIHTTATALAPPEHV